MVVVEGVGRTTGAVAFGAPVVLSGSCGAVEEEDFGSGFWWTAEGFASLGRSVVSSAAVV
jgi:hypothetical protein